jgi:hypothetical protein
MIFFARNAYSQCGCSSAGSMGGATPFNLSDNRGVLQSKNLEVSTFYRYSYASQFYYQDSKVGFGDEEIVNFHLLNLYTAYGLTQNITLEADAGHFYYTTKNLSDTVSGNNFSNLNVSAKLNLLRQKEHSLNLTLGLGGKIPLTSDIIESIGYNMPVTAGYGVLLQMFIGRSVLSGDLSIMNYSRYEINSLDAPDYVFGNSFANSFYFSLPVTNDFISHLELRNSLRASDKINDSTLSNTGSFMFLVAPQLSFHHKTWSFRVGGEIPIYKYMNGTQLTNSFTLFANISKSFDFTPRDEIYEEYLKYKDDFESYDDFKKQFGL